MNHPDYTYDNGKLFLSSQWEELMQRTSFFRFALCLRGEMKLPINDNFQYIQREHLLVLPPNTIQLDNAEASPAFHCLCLGTSPAYLQQILPMADNNWEIKILIESHPVFHLASDEVENICDYYKMLCRRSASPSPFHRSELDALVTAFFYTIMGIVKREVTHTPRSFTAKEYLFKDFIELITSLHPKPRRVEYYADKLCVSAKYLSHACKSCGGQTITEFIDRYVLKDIEYLLTHTSMSIKEISVELDFPNLSFFGRYVKKHLGYSPREYRERIVRQSQD